MRDRPRYVGPKSPQLDAIVARFAEERRIVAQGRESISRLCSLLRVGGAAVTDQVSARVTAALAEAAVFRLGGVLDLLTPAEKATEGPVWIPRFQAAAEPLPYLEFLLEDVQPAALIDGGGVLVNVPHPARFTVHKLLFAGERPAALQAKRDKDLRQVAQLIRVLEEAQPGDLTAASREATSRGSRWRAALRAGVALPRRIEPGSPVGWAK